jgi:hypothetical protein
VFENRLGRLPPFNALPAAIPVAGLSRARAPS